MLSFFLSLRKSDFCDGERNHAWNLKVESSGCWWLKWRLHWENLLLEDLSIFFFVAACCVTNMLECLRKKLNNSFPCHHSIRDRISAVHYYLNRYGIIHYSSSQKEKNTVLVKHTAQKLWLILYLACCLSLNYDYCSAHFLSSPWVIGYAMQPL